MSNNPPQSGEYDRPTGQGRDFADFIVGSDRLDPETQLPLPDHVAEALNTTNSRRNDSPQITDSPTATSTTQEIHTATTSGAASATEKNTHTPTGLPPATTVASEEKKHNKKSTNDQPVIDQHLRPELRDRSEVIGSSVRWFAGWCLRFLIIALATYIATQVFSKLWAGILPVFLALIACTLLWPVVRTLRRLHIPNALAVILTLLGFFSAIVGIFALIAPSAIKQGTQLISQANDGVRTIQDWLQGPPLNLQESQFNEALTSATKWFQDKSGVIATELAAAGSATVSATVTLFVMLVLTFFFLKDGEKFLPMVRRVTGRRVGWHLTEVLTRCWNTLGGFIRTQALVSFIDAFFIGIGLVLLNVPLAGPLAVLTFFAGFIPMVGAFVAGALSVLIALVAIDFTTALIVLILVIAVQQLEGNILQPVLQSRAMNVHPVVILLSITVGSTLFGIVGAFLAVPVAAMIAVVLRYMGDLTDLATGEKNSDEITFTTIAGTLTGEQSERRAQRFRELARLARLNGSNNHDSSADATSHSSGSSSESSHRADGSPKEQGTLDSAHREAAHVSSQEPASSGFSFKKFVQGFNKRS